MVKRCVVAVSLFLALAGNAYAGMWGQFKSSVSKSLHSVSRHASAAKTTISRKSEAAGHTTKHYVDNHKGQWHDIGTRIGHDAGSMFKSVGKFIDDHKGQWKESAHNAGTTVADEVGKVQKYVESHKNR